jgi:hypothetical protein
MGILVLILAGWLGLAYIPARIAASKGRSFVGFYIGGLFCFFPALIVALSISKPEIGTGDIVRLSRSVQLDDGQWLPLGLAAKVLDVDVIDGEPVALVKGSSGSTHWISIAAAGGDRGRSKPTPRPGAGAAPADYAPIIEVIVVAAMAVFVGGQFGLAGTLVCVAGGAAVIMVRHRGRAQGSGLDTARLRAPAPDRAGAASGGGRTPREIRRHPAGVPAGGHPPAGASSRPLGGA